MGLWLCCLNINTKCAFFEKELKGSPYLFGLALQPPSYDITNVDHHVMHTMHTLKNHQLLTKKKYCAMSFIAINLNILIMIDNYANYNIQVF